MNRVITINLNGNAYQLEESGYEALRKYLDHAARRLEGNPDKDEIMADIEQAIADKFRAVLGANKNVVMTKEVENVLIEMGPVQDGSAASAAEGAGNSQEYSQDVKKDRGEAKSGEEAGSPKRLYAIREGAMLVGICNGLGAYFSIDVTIVRILFVILTLFWGMGALVYVIMAFIIPTANTPAEKAAAHGAAATAQEFIRRAKAGYYEGLKSFHDKDARREWKRKFKQDMRGWQYEIHRNARHWQRNWQQGAQHRHYGFNPAFVGPFSWLTNAVLTIVAVFALYSLVKTGVVFGLALPAAIPLWVGVVIVIVLWRIVTAPFRAMQWGNYNQNCHTPCPGLFGTFGDFISGVAILILLVWLGDRFIPGFHVVLKQLPEWLHQAIDSVQRWLEKH